MEEREVKVYTGSIKSAIENIPQELSLLAEETLRKKVNPSIKHYELKRAFWEEFALASDTGNTMRNWRLYEGRYSKAYFYDSILKNPKLMAWIMTPLVEYEDKTKAALDKVTERYDEIISMDITTTKKLKDPEAPGGYRFITETDPKKALVLLQAIKNLEDRVKGTAIQRQVSVHTSDPKGQGNEKTTLNMDKVEQRITEIEGKLNPYKHKRIENVREQIDGNKTSGHEGAVAREVSKDIEAESRRVGAVAE